MNCKIVGTSSQKIGIRSKLLKIYLKILRCISQNNKLLYHVTNQIKKMQTIQNKIVGTLETVKDQLEKRDQAVLGRDKIFASGEAPGAESNEPSE